MSVSIDDNALDHNYSNSNCVASAQILLPHDNGVSAIWKIFVLHDSFVIDKTLGANITGEISASENEP